MVSQEPNLNELLPELFEEVMNYLEDIDVDNDGEHLYSNYQKIAGYSIRLTELHNQILLLEITGRADSELKKFRTLILDTTLERLDKLAQFESRKLTAKSLEMSLDKYEH